MKNAWMLACVAGLALTACDRGGESPTATTESAAVAAGKNTLANGIGGDAKFAAAVKAAGLEPALAGPTPYTLLVPTDAAFDKLPAGDSERLMKPDGREELTALVTTHVLPGTMLASDIAKAIDAGGGKAQIRTLGGGTLTATRDGERVQLSDSKGTRATVTGADDQRSNGIIHRIDAVLMPAR